MTGFDSLFGEPDFPEIAGFSNLVDVLGRASVLAFLMAGEHALALGQKGLIHEDLENDFNMNVGEDGISFSVNGEGPFRLPIGIARSLLEVPGSE